MVLEGRANNAIAGMGGEYTLVHAKDTVPLSRQLMISTQVSSFRQTSMLSCHYAQSATLLALSVVAATLRFLFFIVRVFNSLQRFLLSYPRRPQALMTPPTDVQKSPQVLLPTCLNADQWMVC